MVGLGDRVGSMERCLSNLVHQRGASTSPADIWQEWSSATNDRPDIEGKRKHSTKQNKEDEGAVGVEF